MLRFMNLHNLVFDTIFFGKGEILWGNGITKLFTTFMVVER